jgi:hypothetical protein
MDGIETKVYCPRCRNELSLLLKKQEIPPMIGEILKMLNANIGNESAYTNSIKCSCGETVKIQFTIGTVPGEQRQLPIIGGILP